MSRRKKQPRYLHTQTLTQALLQGPGFSEPEHQDLETKDEAIWRMAGIRKDPEKIKRLIGGERFDVKR